MKLNQDFTMYEGETKSIEVEIENETTESLSGSKLIWSNGGISKEVTVSGSSFTITLNPEDTIGKPGRYTHDAKLIDVNNNASFVLTGLMTVKESRIK
jgi:hypothetical protein